MYIPILFEFCLNIIVYLESFWSQVVPKLNKWNEMIRQSVATKQDAYMPPTESEASYPGGAVA